MASVVAIRLKDDLDGSDADETIKFSLDGTSYEIELTREHAEEMRAAFDQFIASARKVYSGRTSKSARPRSAAYRKHSAEIRAWAKGRNLPVQQYGRIPDDVLLKYNADQRKRADQAKWRTHSG